MSVEKAQDPRGTAKRLLRDLMMRKWRPLTVAIFLMGAAACSVLIPITIGAAIDEIFSGAKRAVENETVFQVGFETMSAVLIELAVLYVLSAALTFAKECLMASAAKNFTLKLRREPPSRRPWRIS